MITMLFCISIVVVKWLEFGIEQVELNEPTLPKRHDKSPWSSNETPWLSRGPPGSFQLPPPDPWQAGHMSQELVVSIPGNVLGNIAETRVLCHVKKLGSMKSSWELFLSAVWSQVNNFGSQELFAMFQELFQKFPGTVPGNFFHVPRWPYSNRTVHGTCLSKKI